MSTRMPAHVRRYLEASGRIDPVGISRNARIVFCPSCHAITIRGLDHDRCAALVNVDPTPLTPISELECLLSGGRTFDLFAHGGHYRIEDRASWRIAGHPAGTFEGDVVAQHRCGFPAPSSTLPSAIAPVRVTHAPEDRCPF